MNEPCEVCGDTAEKFGDTSVVPGTRSRLCVKCGNFKGVWVRPIKEGDPVPQFHDPQPLRSAKGIRYGI